MTFSHKTESLQTATYANIMSGASVSIKSIQVGFSEFL